jgi:hypothetical protein
MQQAWESFCFVSNLEGVNTKHTLPSPPHRHPTTLPTLRAESFERRVLPSSIYATTYSRPQPQFRFISPECLCTAPHGVTSHTFNAERTVFGEEGDEPITAMTAHDDTRTWASDVGVLDSLSFRQVLSFVECKRLWQCPLALFARSLHRRRSSCMTMAWCTQWCMWRSTASSTWISQKVIPRSLHCYRCARMLTRKLCFSQLSKVPSCTRYVFRPTYCCT